MVTSLSDYWRNGPLSCREHVAFFVLCDTNIFQNWTDNLQTCVWQSSDEGHCTNFFLSPRPCQCDAIWLIKYTHLKALKPAFIAIVQNYNILSEIIHWFISVIQSWLKPQAMKSNQGQPGTRGPLVFLTMTALQADNFISCFVLSFDWKCHTLVKVTKENAVHYQIVKSTSSQLPSKMITEYLSPELLCNWHQNRCTECMSDEDCPDCGEVDPFFF